MTAKYNHENKWMRNDKQTLPYLRPKHTYTQRKIRNTMSISNSHVLKNASLMHNILKSFCMFFFLKLSFLFNETSSLMNHFVSSPKERERNRREWGKSKCQIYSINRRKTCQLSPSAAINAGLYHPPPPPPPASFLSFFFSIQNFFPS